MLTALPEASRRIALAKKSWDGTRCNTALTVVSDAVPGREPEALHVRCEELQRVLQDGETLTVAGDVQDRPALLAACDESRKRNKYRCLEPFRHAAGNDRTARKQPRDRQSF